MTIVSNKNYPRTWTHMFVMASTNSRIVRRSAGYLQSEDAGYTKDIKYM